MDGYLLICIQLKQSRIKRRPQTMAQATFFQRIVDPGIASM
jgi:hypothetical protein